RHLQESRAPSTHVRRPARVRRLGRRQPSAPCGRMQPSQRYAPFFREATLLPCARDRVPLQVRASIFVIAGQDLDDTTHALETADCFWRIRTHAVPETEGGKAAAVLRKDDTCALQMCCRFVCERPVRLAQAVSLSIGVRFKARSQNFSHATENDRCGGPVAASGGNRE